MAEKAKLTDRYDEKLKEQADPFYHPMNMAVLRRSIQEAHEGKFVTKTLDELRSMEG